MLAYCYLFHTALERLKAAHPDRPARVIADHFETRGAGFDRVRVEEPDRDYLRGRRVNMHRMIPLALGGIREDLEVLFNEYRNIRNVASYELESRFDPQSSVDVVHGIVEFADQIESF